jgi:hypothetical protein
VQGREDQPHAGNGQHNGKALAPAGVLDGDERLLEERTPGQQKCYRDLNGDGGFSSWERVLGAATPENRADILKNALGQLLPLAKAAAVSAASPCS